MKLRTACMVVGSLSLALSTSHLTLAQTSTRTASALPRLVRFTGTVKDLSRTPLSGVIGITFAHWAECFAANLQRTGGFANRGSNVCVDGNLSIRS